MKVYKLIVSVKKSDGTGATFGVVCQCLSDKENVVKNLKEDYEEALKYLTIGKYCLEKHITQKINLGRLALKLF